MRSMFDYTQVARAFAPGAQSFASVIKTNDSANALCPKVYLQNTRRLFSLLVHVLDSTHKLFGTIKI